jgi:hypothetical protein
VDFPRAEGRSSPWILAPVSAGQEEVVCEVEAAGFRFLEERPILEENYFLRIVRN